MAGLAMPMRSPDGADILKRDGMAVYCHAEA